MLGGDRRGMLRLRPLLPADAWEQAARALHAHRERVLVLTGFTIGGLPETDGPPGAIAIAQALEQLGGHATIVSDAPTCAALRQLDDTQRSRPGGQGSQSGQGSLRHPLPAWLELPIEHGAAGLAHTRRLLAELRPTAIVSIERCGPGQDGRYRTMRGIDITADTAPLDLLLLEAPTGCLTLGIGDGGNEVGMGTLATSCLELGVTPHPCVVPAQHLLLAAVSTWGGWGLVAALSEVAGQRLLPGEEETRILLEDLVAAGCIDGISGLCEASIDGFDLDDTLRRLRDLHDLLDLYLPR